MKTLQAQYNLIKEGKGDKAYFMKLARYNFPDLVTPVLSYSDTITVLKNKSILSEGIGGVVTTGKKQDWHAIFNENMEKLKEKKDDEDEEEDDDDEKYKEKIDQYEKREKDIEKFGLQHLKHLKEAKEAKAEEKETTKDVTDMATRGYDYKDEKNYDNVFGQEFLQGYYAEMKDPKNSDKTMQELKDIVMKNLQKDPIHYTKDGQFGEKGLGYTTEVPGLGTPKEIKGKYKSSGYGDLKESIQPLNEEDKLRKVIREMISEELNTEEFKNTLIKLEQPYLNDKEALGDIQKIYSSHIQGLNSISQNLKESVEKELAAINKEAEHEIIASKLEKVQALIDKKQSQLSKLDEDEDMKSLTDDKKVKEISKDIKSLEKAKVKLEKLMGKGKTKDKKTKVLGEVELEPTAEYLAAKEDAENRYDEGEEIDSILSNYPNLPFDERNMLRIDLEGKMNGMDY